MSDIENILTGIIHPDGTLVKRASFEKDGTLSKVHAHSRGRYPHCSLQQKGAYVLVRKFLPDGKTVDSVILSDGTELSGKDFMETPDCRDIFFKNKWLEKWLDDRETAIVESKEEKEKKGENSPEFLSREEQISILKRFFSRYSPKPADRVIYLGKYDAVKDANIKIPNRISVKYETTPKAILKILTDYGVKQGEPPKITYIFGML